MTESVDLAAYFERIGFRGDARPDLATLQALHRLHPEAIAFENLSPLLRLGVPLEIEALERKMVRAKRGGWCFEHNTLFQHVLTAIGFESEGWIARVIWGQPEDKIAPCCHMVLRVPIDGVDYIADVGFGGNVLTAPLRFVPDIEQSTPHGSFRLLRLDVGFKLQAQIGGEWTSLYRFEMQRQHPVDYEVASHFVETHPSSIFLTNFGPDATSIYGDIA